MPRTWLITGVSRGIGRALMEVVLATGDTVVATARDERDVAGVAARDGGSVLALRLDVTDRAAGGEVVRRAVEAFGGLDVVVIIAEHGDVGAIEAMAEEDFRAQVEVNLWGAINVTRAALPVLRERGGGHIVQIASPGGGGDAAALGLGSYSTATWGLEGFFGVLAKEVGPLGIRVTLAEPGGASTARAIVAATEAEDPPLHLPLSEDAGPAVTCDGPLVFVATNRLKAGAAPAERRRAADLVRFVEEQEPQMLAFNEYVNADGTETTVVQVHPDAASMTRHLAVVADRAAAAYAETLDGTLHIQIYGPMDSRTLEAMRAQTGGGTVVTVASEHLGGFTRLGRAGQ